MLGIVLFSAPGVDCSAFCRNRHIHDEESHILRGNRAGGLAERAGHESFYDVGIRSVGNTQVGCEQDDEASAAVAVIFCYLAGPERSWEASAVVR